MTAPSGEPPLGDTRLSRVRFPSAFAEAGSDCPEFASPGYAAPSEFRTPLTPCSSRNLSTVFQTETLLGFRSSKDSPSAAWSAPLGRSCPPGVGSNGSAALATEPRSPPGLSSPRKSVAALSPKRQVRPVPPLSFPPFRVASSFATAPLVTETPPLGLSAVGGEPPALLRPSESRSRRTLMLSAESIAPPEVLRLISASRVSASDRSITTLTRKLVRAPNRVKGIHPECGNSRAAPRNLRAFRRETASAAARREGGGASSSRGAGCRFSTRWRTLWITEGNGAFGACAKRAAAETFECEPQSRRGLGAAAENYARAPSSVWARKTRAGCRHGECRPNQDGSRLDRQL